MEQPDEVIELVEGTAHAPGEATPESAHRPNTTANHPPRVLDRTRLINRLNYASFQNRTVLLDFEHATYGDAMRVAVRPQACDGERLRCTWIDPRVVRALARSYVFSTVCVPDEERVLQGRGSVVSIDEDGITIALALTCTETELRRVVRHPCRDIHVALLSSGARFDGTLLDFSPCSFRVRIGATPPQTFAWLNATAPVTVVLSHGHELLYSGDCKIVSHTPGRGCREYVLEPSQERIQRFEPQKHRSVRQELVPPPTIVFEHPLTKRLVSLKVLDLSTSGLAVEEYARNAVLLPGLMIPRLDLCLVGNLRLPCRAQVVHRQVLQPQSENSCLKYGLALLDMDIAHHVQLVALLHHADDARSYVCNQVDMDALWSFFFDTGFIYPEKYGFIEKNREEIKQTYDKLYAHSPSIARHFIYQDRGKILGHMAMLRFYDSTWLIHHHAARSSYTFKAGLNVLEQITRFVTESCRFAFMHMDYVICFYRPENNFPRNIFGGVCRDIGDARQCSEALFAYFHLRGAGNGAESVHRGDDWSPADVDDLHELSRFCRHESTGLLTGALNLEPADLGGDDLGEEFRKLGLVRERQIYALKTADRLQAIAMVNLADIGLNLSDLTNAITLFVLDQHGLTTEILRGALSALLKRLALQEIPMLVYPEAAATCLNLPVEKRYVMWSLMPHYSDSYNRSLNAIFRGGRRNGGSHDKRRSPPL